MPDDGAPSGPDRPDRPTGGGIVSVERDGGPAVEPGVGAESRLARRLGRLDATMLVAGTIIGSGIFLAPGLIADDVGTPGLSVLVWIVCGVLALCGALCYAELSAAIPRTGGTHPYLKRAYGTDLLPFLYAWSMLFVVYTGATAAVATGFSVYAGNFIEQWMPYDVWTQRAVAVGCILFLGIMNAIGVQVGGRIQTGITFVKIAALIAIIGVGFAFGAGDATHFTPLLPEGGAGAGTLAAFGTAMIVGLFAYNGWWMSSFVAGEVREPRRSIPISIIAGMSIVLLVYVLVNLAYMYVLPFDVLRGSERPAADAVAWILGPVGGGLVTAAVMVSTFGTVNAQMLAYPRIYFVLGEGSRPLRWLTWVHPKFRTPAAAILAQTFWASLLALSGTYAQIITYGAFPNYLFLSLAVAGVIILRRREPDLQRPYRVWGYPVTPLLFLTIMAWYLINSAVYSFGDTMVGVVLTMTGLPFYLWWRRGGRTPSPS